jgi:hypothetical protein
MQRDACVSAALALLNSMLISGTGVSMSNESFNHFLIIVSLHDADAECACGEWHYTHTGPRTRGEIEAEYRTHLVSSGRHDPKPNRGTDACPTCGSTNSARRLRLAGDPLDFSRHDYWCDDDWHHAQIRG